MRYSVDTRMFRASISGPCGSEDSTQPRQLEMLLSLQSPLLVIAIAVSADGDALGIFGLPIDLIDAVTWSGCLCILVSVIGRLEANMCLPVSRRTEVRKGRHLRLSGIASV